MKMYTQLLLGLALFTPALLVPVFTVEADTVVRSGDLVSIVEDQSIEGDFYTAARKINLSGTATEDMVAIGQNITINGTIEDNAFLVADVVDMFGSVGDDLRIIARDVTIAEPVAGDVFVVAGTVRIPSTASIGGDALIYAQEVIIEGVVGGDVLGTIDSLRIDAQIGGDVDVAVGELTLGDRALVDGSISYESNEVLIRSQNAVISGDVVRNDPVLPGNEASIRLAIVPSLILLFSVLAWYLVARKSLRATVKNAITVSPRPFFIGLLLLLFAPVAAVVLMGSVVGVLVGITALLFYFVLLLLGIAAAAALAGQLAMKAFDHDIGPVGLTTLLVGVAIMTILMLLPYIGQFLFALLFILAIGSMVDLLFRSQH